MLIAVIALIVGIAIGAAGMHLHRLRGSSPGTVALDESGTRWEAVDRLPDRPLERHLRRAAPTHDVHCDVAFGALVRPKGVRGAEALRRTAGWTVEAVLVDKRTGVIDRVLLADNDADAQEKRWVLRRAGLRVAMIARDVDEEGAAAAIAA